MKDKFLTYKGNFSSIRLSMLASYIISVSLLIVACIGFLLGKSDGTSIELLKTASWILSIGVGGKTFQGIAENYKESRVVIEKEYRKEDM